MTSYVCFVQLYCANGCVYSAMKCNSTKSLFLYNMMFTRSWYDLKIIDLSLQSHLPGGNEWNDPLQLYNMIYKSNINAMLVILNVWQLSLH